jgi:hypothetical protein
MEKVYEGWSQLMNEYSGVGSDHTPLYEWGEEDLIFARTYIGRELTRRALAENPNATESLLQEKPRS